MEAVFMSDVRERNEEYPVKLTYSQSGRPCILALNEGGYNSTSVDLLDLLSWVKHYKPELWEQA
jgi:hypothetical protein